MSEGSFEADFAVAQTGRGACLVSFTRSSDCNVQTMEAFAVRENGSHVPTFEGRGYHGLHHDERDAASPASFNDFADSIFAETDKRGLTMLFSIWIVDRESFRTASR